MLVHQRVIRDLGAWRGESDRHWFTRNYLIGKATLQLSYINKRQHHLCPGPQCEGKGVPPVWWFSYASGAQMAVRLPYSNSGYVPSTALRCARRSFQLRRDERCRCSEQKTRWLKKMMLKAFEHSLTNKNRETWVIPSSFLGEANQMLTNKHEGTWVV